MAEFQFQSIADSFLGGLNNGRRMRAEDEQRQDRLTLRDLAAGAIGGDPRAQAQAYAIDPNAGKAYASAAEQQAAKMRGAALHVKRAMDSGNPAAAERAYQDVYGFLAQINPQAPRNFTPEMRAKIEEVIATTAYLEQGANGMPAGFREHQLMSQGLSPEDEMKARRVALGLDPRPSSGLPFGFMEVMGADGRTRVVATDKRSGAASPVGGGPAPTSAPNADAIASAMSFMVQSGMPAEQVEAWGMQQLGGTPAPQSASPGAFVSPTPGAVKRDEVLGSKGAEFEVDRQRANFDAEQAAAIEAAKVEAKNAAERHNEQVGKGQALQVYDTAMASVRSGLASTTTGPIAGRMPALSANQQTADGAIAAIAPVLKQLFRSSGEGVFTDKDQELLMRMIPTRTDHPEARKAKIDNIDAIVKAKLSAMGGTKPKVIRYDNQGNRIP